MGRPEMNPYGGVWKGLSVLVTGHTGFKGSWLCHWLLGLGAEVTGASLEPSTNPSHFSILKLEGRMNHHIIDVRNRSKLEGLVTRANPQIIFHLAAQPLVRASYRDPAGTWETNLVGTLNLLEILRLHGSTTACVVVTTDKCYENHETGLPFREDSPLGGHDPYSASKAAVEILVSSHRRSYPTLNAVATARAGNVIGGGDWSPERITTDIVEAVRNNSSVRLRNPDAVRPWQHVLDALSAYLALGARLLDSDDSRFARAWNFGPPGTSSATVEELANGLRDRFGRGNIVRDTAPSAAHEASLLRLDCSDANSILGWHAAWDLNTTLDRLVEWHQAFDEGADPSLLADMQIESYVEAAAAVGCAWTGGSAWTKVA